MNGINNTHSSFVNFDRDALRIALKVVVVIELFIAAWACVGIATSLSTSPKVWTDQKTGCQYIRSGAGITPRMNSMGLQTGCIWHNPDNAPVLPDMPPPPPDIVVEALPEQSCVR